MMVMAMATTVTMTATMVTMIAVSMKIGSAGCDPGAGRPSVEPAGADGQLAHGLEIPDPRSTRHHRPTTPHISLDAH